MDINRLQGTDGIRGRISLAKSCSDLDPISVFLREGLLTEEFFELYIYAYCVELIETNFATKNSPVVIGWDPRKISSIFYKSAIRGIRKAGLKAVILDILPTPAISLYQIHISASCGFVLTASHNPGDQSGIKIFLGYSNLKLFPEDDKRLTTRCLKINFEEIKLLPLIGEISNEHIEARKLFIKFLNNYNNRWADKDIFKGKTVIVDCANGAFSNLMNDLVKSESGDFVVTNVDYNKGINNKSGVADLEGLKEIFPEQIINGRFSKYESISLVLRKGREKNYKLKNSSDMVYGIVFDGDGDRCFLLVYDPFKDCVLVLGGDLLAFFQSKFLYNKYYSYSKYFFINTIESDIEASRAAQKIGYKQIQCAVGDKWILWHAFYNQIQIKLINYLKLIKEQEFHNLVDETKLFFENMIQCSKLDALSATKKILSLENWIRINKGDKILQKVNNFLCEHSNNDFAVGCEDSGHLITLGSSFSKKNRVPVYIGNSYKSAINSLTAIQEYHESNNSPEFYDLLINPFPSGYKKSLQIYYVDKSMLREESPTRKKVIKLILENSRWPKIEKKFEQLFDDPEMIIFRALENGFCVGSIFVRNSGTEDKLSIYLRGTKNFSEKLDHLSEKIYPFLLTLFKNKKSEMACAELKVLELLANRPRKESCFSSAKFNQIPLERLLNEMSARQNLIKKEDGNWFITTLGLRLLNFSERSE